MLESEKNGMATERCECCRAKKPYSDYAHLDEPHNRYQGFCRECEERKKRLDRRKQHFGDGPRTCGVCGQTKPLPQFHWDGIKKDFTTECIACCTMQRVLAREHGITIEQYNWMLEAQGGMCAICGGAPKENRKLAVDHDHKTGRIRGLLCHKCNTSLGGFQDSPDILRSAIRYLKRTSK
jgi:hypothetical protein